MADNEKNITSTAAGLDGLTQSEAQKRIIQYGYNEVPEEAIHPIFTFLKKFWGVSPVLLILIIVVSFFLHKNDDAYIVFGLLVFNAIIGFAQENNASKAVKALRKKLQISMKVFRDATWRTIPSREIVPGDVVRIRAGDFIPADVQLVSGPVTIDQSLITGESTEISKKVYEIVYSGAIVTRGESTAVVIATAINTFYGKTIELVRAAKPKSHISEVIFSMVKWLMLIVGSLLMIAAVITHLKGGRLLEILPLVLVLLLGAIPVALSAMFTVSMALASKQLLKQGVLITRLNAPDDAASMDVLFVDKTGTLTINKLAITKLEPAVGFKPEDVLLYGALASQEANNDSIDLAFISLVRQKEIALKTSEQKSFIPFTAENRKTEAVIVADGLQFKVMKGAFKTVAEACSMNEKELNVWSRKVKDFAGQGFKTLAVAKTDEKGKYIFIGIASLQDAPREDSARLVDELKRLGVTVKMLTGDALPIAVNIAKTVNIGDKIIRATDLKESENLLEENNGVAEVYPEDKYKVVKDAQSKGHIVGMTGDGVNDAPALRQAEVGIAVANASDVAKSSAGIVLTQEGLTNILSPIKTGRMMFERINIWILNKFARTILKTCFVVISFVLLGKYVISATAMLIMIFMTDFVKLSLAADNVRWEAVPSKWQIRRLAKVGSVIGLLMTIEALGILYIGLHFLGLKADSDALSTFCFEILLFFALFSIFVVREKKHFWNSAPAKIVLLVIAGDMLAAILFTTFGLLNLTPIPFYQTGAVIGYSLVFSLLVNDYIKVYLLRNVVGW